MKITVLILMLSLVSCTIQKRVHRPGWNVQWNHNYKESKQSVPLKEEPTISGAEKEEQIQDQPENKEQHTLSARSEYDYVLTDDVHVHERKELMRDNNERSALVAKTIQITDINTSMHSPEIGTKSPTSGNTKKLIAPIVLSSVGLVLFGIGMFMYFVLGNPGAGSVIATIFGIMFSTIGGILLIVGLILLTVFLIMMASDKT